MRLVITILFLAPLALFSQTNFAKQLDKLIKDSTNYFKSFKSNFKETRFTDASPDSIFYTNLSLDGTSNNELLIAADEYIFMADVTDSLDELKGKKLINEWRDKINSVLGNGFVVEEVKSSDGNPSKYGWDFSRGNVTVNIGLFPHKKNSNLNWIGLAVSVFEDEEILAKKTN
jgi:hypothetical protein